jgi:hypothetical protein
MNADMPKDPTYLRGLSDQPPNAVQIAEVLVKSGHLRKAA